jgi:hypothetical protein
MSIAIEIQRLNTAKADIKAAIEAKGVTVPSNATIDTYDDYVSQISGGGGSTADTEALKGVIDKSLTSIVIPSGATKIGNNIFSSCSNLTACTIPNSVTSIGGYAFSSCSGLISIEIPSGVTTIGDYAFYYCTSLTSITMPNSVTTIGFTTFRNCKSLTRLNSDVDGVANIPTSITSIAQNLFFDCGSLTSINIPASVTSIGNNAFANCYSLTSVTCNATTPPTLGSTTFSSTNNCLIYVPAASVDTYKAANNWSKLASRIQAIPNS